MPLRSAGPATATVDRNAPGQRSFLSPFTFGAVLIAVSMLPVTGVSQAQPLAPPPPPPCSNQTAPPPPVDTSEVPKPGEPSPEPLPVPAEPVGGELLGSCDAPILPNGAPPPHPEITAPTWLVADVDSGEVLAALDPHARQRPASVIKTLTALVVLRQLELEDTLVATQEDANQEGSSVGLAVGATYTVRQVLTGMIMQSGNDAAHALAMKLGGMDSAVAQMNELALELGAKDTRAATPSGLDGPGMSTSAYDMALIFRAAMQDPEFVKAIGTTQMDMPGPPGQPGFAVGTDNQVLLNYPGGLGGKTGFTDDARHTFIAAAERDGRRLVAVMLRGENQPVKLSRQTMHLLDYGFTLPAEPGIGRLVPEKAEQPPPPPAPEQPKAVERTEQVAGKSPLFGTVGGPLTMLFASALVVVGVFGFWRRRAKLAAAERRKTPPQA